MEFSDTLGDPDARALQHARTAMIELRAARADLERLLQKRKETGPSMPSPAMQNTTADAAQDAEAEGDLTQLPGVGPGLAWMLKQSGVPTIARLAQCDADDLTSGLGIVSSIVDPRTLISAAQAHRRLMRHPYFHQLTKAA